jgi:hypothetical protein
VITALQNRIAAILTGSATFTGVPILVDTKPSFVNEAAQGIARQDLLVLVGYATGEVANPEGSRPAFLERISVIVVQHRLHTAHSAVALMEAAALLLHDAPVTSGGRGPQRFRVVSHRSDIDEEGTIAAELIVETLAALA